MTDAEKYCETCDHIEMCKWTPISGCAFHSKYEKRPHGEWIFKHNSSDIWCSVCDENFEEIQQRYNFCPNCGANMRDKKEDLAEIIEAAQSMKKGEEE